MIIREPLEGFHNKDLKLSQERLIKGATYKDASTVWITITRGMIPAHVVSSWVGLMRPMNQKIFGPLFIEGEEVAEGYNKAIEFILENPELSKFKYLLTVEEDNCPPVDGLLKLYEGMDKFDVIGGLYWTKGEGGQPMIYGNPKDMPKNFIPQIPLTDSIQPCNGLGMGFNLYKLSMFKKLSKPWFKTVQEAVGAGGRQYSQDLYFYETAGREGYKFACDTRVLVGHWDQQNGRMW